MKTTVKEEARFNARLPKRTENIFEKAALLGGYRSLTDFVILAVQEKAKEIIQEKEQILSSERDGKIFFDAITKPSKPNKALTDAFNDYNAYISNEK